MNSKKDKIRVYNSVVDEVIMLPRRSLSFIGSASADELRVLIFLFGEGENFDIDSAAKALKIPIDTVNSALHYWRGAKVITTSADVEESKPTTKRTAAKINTVQVYEPQLLAEKVDDDKRLRMLVDYVSDRFEKGVLNKNDINSLYYLYDYINIPAELICGIVEYCVENNRKSMNYLVKTAINLFEEQEVDTYEKLEAYLTVRREYNEASSRFRRLAGMADRGLTTNEKKMLSLWFEERLYPFELVEFAYELTINSIQKYNINYLNSILERWFTEGITTLEQAQENVKSFKEKNKNFDNKTYDFDDFFSAALARK